MGVVLALWSLQSGGGMEKGVKTDGILTLAWVCVWVSVKVYLWPGGCLSVFVGMLGWYTCRRGLFVCAWFGMGWVCNGNGSML